MNFDGASMQARQPSQHPIGALYQRYVLDRIVEVARNISHDFVRRPRHYRAVPEKIAIILEGFRVRTGSDPDWLSAEQREVIFGPIFGSNFCSSSAGLRSAATAYVERGIKESAALTQQVLDEASAFRTYLRDIEGQVVSMADRATGAVFQSALEVVGSKEVAEVFNSPAVTERDWLLAETGREDVDSSAGGSLIVQVQRTLALAPARPVMTFYRFTILQRIAFYGALTIAGAFNEAGLGNGDHAQQLVRNAYGWEKALQALLSGIDVVRAWKEPQYREGLSQFERLTMAPHPAGEVDLKGTQLDPAMAARSRGGGLGFSTQTVSGEICCSTGDLYCTESSQRTSHIECGNQTASFAVYDCTFAVAFD